jgi:EAL domain-containing protein (putative c-di-GMP-specific phosphodiesterase class I)
VILLEGLGTDQSIAATHAEAIAGKIRLAVSEPFELNENVHYATPSIGVTLFHNHDEGAEMLFRQADLALYQAKDAGRNTIRFYSPTMQSLVDDRAKLEAGLRRALAENEFILHFQSQVDDAGKIMGAEALLRWKPPGQDLIPPAEFIPVAEDCGLIVAIGSWVLEDACRTLAGWAGKPGLEDLRLSINISARQFQQPEFVNEVKSALERNGARADRLVLELTEGLLMKNVETAILIMKSLKQAGVGFSIDDFGIGYSSLAYLKRLPLDQIKIDRSFVRDIAENQDDRAIVQAIISMAESLGLEVIAEGVETEAQRAFLADHRCHAYQGYLFSRPVPAEELERLFGRR